MTTPTPAPVTPVAPTPGTPEYDAAMAAKGAGTVVTQTGAPAPQAETVARPEGLPEKFKSWADMAASYAELEKKLGAPAPVTPPVTPATPAPVSPDSKLAITPEQAAVTAAGLDMAALSQEFTDKGDLTPESYAALEKSGIPKPMVAAYIAGQKALAAQYDAAAFGIAGSEENFGKMIGWATTGMSPQEQVVFNAAVRSGDQAKMSLAVSGLKSKFEAVFGSSPTLVTGGVAVSGDVYRSMKEVTVDMHKPEYKKDPAFRAKVQEKLGRSDIGAVSQRS